MKIRYRPKALAQLDEIFTYIAADAAHRVIAAIKHRIDLRQGERNPRHSRNADC